MMNFEHDRVVFTTNLESPLVATAIHSGHQVREELAGMLEISEANRLREEDPFTDRWTMLGGSRIVVNVSRFEVDLNRTRENAVYIRPEDAWGLHVWKSRPKLRLIEGSLRFYDSFYEKTRNLFDTLISRHGYFLVLDLHSYNHRRSGPDGPADDAKANPEVNIGTGNLDRVRWGATVDGLMHDLSNFDYLGRKLDVRENVKFRGGHFSRWISETFGDAGCTIAIEFKKFFMDEWSGRPDELQLAAIAQALMAAIPGLMKNSAAAAKSV